MNGQSGLVNRRMRPISLCVASTLSLLILFADNARAQTTLRWKFEPGQTLSVSFVQHTATKASGIGKPTSIVIDMTMTMTWNVVSVGDAGARITQRFDRLATSMNTGDGKPIVYDSNDANVATGSARGIAAAVQPLIGAEFVVTMSDRGEIKAVEVPEEVESALTSKDATALKSLLSKEGLRNTLEKSLTVLPEGPKQVGDEWTSETMSQLPFGKLLQRTDYKYGEPEQSDDRSLDKITATGTLTLEPSDNAKPDRFKLTEQERTGTLLFDNAEGRLVAAEFEQSMTTERPYRGQAIKVETTSSTKLTIAPGER